MQFAMQHPLLTGAGLGLLVAAVVVASLGFTATAAIAAPAVAAGVFAGTATFFSRCHNEHNHNNTEALNVAPRLGS